MMKQLLKLGLLSVVAAIGLSASTITFTYSGTASGTLGQASFSDAAFTVTGVGDTTNVFVNPGNSSVLGLHLDSASIDIAGQGIFSITSAMGAFVAHNAQFAGIAHGDGGGSDLIHTAVDASLGTWDLASSIGPITGPGNILQWGIAPVNTTGGTLFFSDANCNHLSGNGWKCNPGTRFGPAADFRSGCTRPSALPQPPGLNSFPE
jgi:hypothetical protein